MSEEGTLPQSSDCTKTNWSGMTIICFRRGISCGEELFWENILVCTEILYERAKGHGAEAAVSRFRRMVLTLGPNLNMKHCWPLCRTVRPYFYPYRVKTVKLAPFQQKSLPEAN
jgi:hypothetical protein